MALPNDDPTASPSWPIAAEILRIVHHAGEILRTDVAAEFPDLEPAEFRAGLALAFRAGLWTLPGTEQQSLAVRYPDAVPHLSEPAPTPVETIDLDVPTFLDIPARPPVSAPAVRGDSGHEHTARDRDASGAPDPAGQRVDPLDVDRHAGVVRFQTDITMCPREVAILLGADLMVPFLEAVDRITQTEQHLADIRRERARDAQLKVISFRA